MKFIDFLKEQKEKHAVMAFGRMNPITVGHEKLVNKVQEIAKKVGGSAHIVVSHSQDPKKNPLTAEQKLKHAKRAFPGVNVSASDKDAPNFLAQAAKLHKQGVTHFHMVGGSDRADEYHKLLHKYNDVKGPHGHFNFKHIKVHSAGERDPDAEGVEGMSASKMREHASKGNFKEFRKGVPSKMTDAHAKEMYNHVRQGMGVHENIDLEFEQLLVEGVHDKSIFKAVFLAGGPGSGKDYVLDNTLSGHGLTEINSDKALEFLMDKKGLDKTMPKSEKAEREVVRGRAKDITEIRQRLALNGRNGLIINGTGDDYEKISKIKKKLEELGYETKMVLVNTRDEVSAQRNIERGMRGGRTVPENIRKEKWDGVQENRTNFAKLFGQDYHEFDNSEDLRKAPPEVVKQKKEEMLDLYRNVQDFTARPSQNEIAQNWIANELQKKDTLKIPKDGAEQTPPQESNAYAEARKLGLTYYGFGRYGRNGKVTHRSVHDRLIEIPISEAVTMNISITGDTPDEVNQMFKSFIGQFESEEDVQEDSAFTNSGAYNLLTLGKTMKEDVLVEDLRKWFDPKDPEGGWKRINSKGEAIGPCAREPGEGKPKCMSNEKRAKLTKKERAAAVAAKRRHDPVADRAGKGGKPVNVSNFGKGKISEELLDEGDKVKLLRDKNGKLKTFLLRRSAAKEAHLNNGMVMKHPKGYVIKIKEDNDVEISQRPIFSETSGQNGRTESRTSATTSGRTQAITESQTTSKKITLTEIRERQKNKIQESIDKGIEPGMSMSASGENLSRGSLKTKQNKKPFEEAIGAGGEDANSIGAKKEDDLKKVGITLSTFKAKRPI